MASSQRPATAAPLARRRRSVKSAVMSSPYSVRNAAGYTHNRMRNARMAASAAVQREARRAGEPHHVGEAAHFGACDDAPESGHAVVAAPLVVFTVGRTFAHLFQHSVLQHALNGSIERTEAHLDRAAGTRRDVL